MVVGDYGYRKIIELIDAEPSYLAGITALKWVVVRPDSTQIEKTLGQSDRDSGGNFTWLLQAGDLTLPGFYRCQAVDVSSGRQIGTYVSLFEVRKLLAGAPTPPIDPNPEPSIVEYSPYLVISQTNHGFQPGNGICYTPTGWIKSRAAAGELDNNLCVGIDGPDRFVRAAVSGVYSVPGHGYPLNQVLYVGPVAGQLTADPALIPAENQSPNLLRLIVAECPSPNQIIFRPQLEPT